MTVESWWLIPFSFTIMALWLLTCVNVVELYMLSQLILALEKYLTNLTIEALLYLKCILFSGLLCILNYYCWP